MADYVAITDAQVDPEAPITSELMSALRDNPLAIAEGAIDAPRIQTAGIDDLAVTTAKLDDGAITSGKLSGGTRSFSGSLSRGGGVTIALSDLYAFAPLFSGGSTNTLTFIQGGYRIQNGADEGFSFSYSLSWRYIG